MNRPTTRLLTALTLPTLLMACSPAPVDNKDITSIKSGNVSVMLALDPAITTIYMEAARLSALRTDSTVTISPGKYCANFVQPAGNAPLTARIELTIQGRDRYLYAERYVQGDLVRSDNQAGLYKVTGQALSLLSSENRERIMPLDGATPDSIDRWGDLPLSRQACLSEPLQGDDFQKVFDAKQGEQRSPLPWDKTAK